MDNTNKKTHNKILLFISVAILLSSICLIYIYDKQFNEKLNTNIQKVDLIIGKYEKDKEGNLKLIKASYDNTEVLSRLVEIDHTNDSKANFNNILVLFTFLITQLTVYIYDLIVKNDDKKMRNWFLIHTSILYISFLITFTSYLAIPYIHFCDSFKNFPSIMIPLTIGFIVPIIYIIAMFITLFCNEDN